MTTRRSFLGGGAAGLALVLGAGLGAGWSRTFAAFASEAATRTYEVTHTDAEWHKLLNADQYAVLRQAATERPGSSPLLNEHRRGVFTCAGCQLDAFNSTTKFESGTGWPSFWKPLDNAVISDRDTTFGMVRTAISCRRCGGHLGHVFDDGPKPTGLRYCMNGVALGFKPVAV